ncbi:hypothetical protein ES332_A05G250700v1 [Gossypium tomentosum]|uniref:Uncharacterized protein n=1 Tax=Gossypium tomentosum TaxID=34277 RepID=A0A5D2QIM9_GOSTO|nr:hypothetical protein ES332_A05G250700v1 [Gossypium tomentosum]
MIESMLMADDEIGQINLDLDQYPAFKKLSTAFMSSGNVKSERPRTPTKRPRGETSGNGDYPMPDASTRGPVSYGPARTNIEPSTTQPIYYGGRPPRFKSAELREWYLPSAQIKQGVMLVLGTFIET